VRDVLADWFAEREVAFVSGEVNWVELDRRQDVKSCLLEPERHSPDAAEQLNGGEPPLSEA